MVPNPQQKMPGFHDDFDDGDISEWEQPNKTGAWSATDKHAYSGEYSGHLSYTGGKQGLVLARRDFNPISLTSSTTFFFRHKGRPDNNTWILALVDDQREDVLKIKSEDPQGFVYDFSNDSWVGNQWIGHNGEVGGDYTWTGIQADFDTSQETVRVHESDPAQEARGVLDVTVEYNTEASGKVSMLELRTEEVDGGDEGRALSLFDDISLKNGEVQETSTPSATLTETATPTHTATVTPPSTSTITRTLTPTNQIPYNLEGGKTTRVSPGNQELYVITEIPDAADNQVAVTTTDFNLVSVDLTRDALYSYVWKGSAWGRDTESEIEKTVDFRKSEQRDRLFGHFVDAGWDITMLINLGLVLGPTAALGATVDGILEEVPWAVQAVQQPYKQAFQEMTASLTDAKKIADEIETITSYKNIGTQSKNIISTAGQIYDSGKTAVQFYDDFLTALDETGSLIKSSRAAVTGATGFFGGLGASLVVDEIESVIKAKTTIHSVGFAYATVRLPVLRALAVIKSKVSKGTASPADIYLYHRYLFTDYQMSAVAWKAVGEYWKRISQSSTGPAWDIIVNAGSKAETAIQMAMTMRETAKITLNLLGAGQSTVLEQLGNSINMEVYDGGGS